MRIANLFVLEPGEGLGGEDEPVVPAASLHDPQVVDRHVSLPDHLNTNKLQSLACKHYRLEEMCDIYCG